MKLISKHRDYYDHLISHYGYDETIVYDRRGDILADPHKNHHHLISICGAYYPVVAKNNKIYFNTSKELDYWDNDFFEKNIGKRSFENVQFRQPILIACGKYIPNKNIYKRGQYVESYVIPILSNFKIPSIIDAHEMYQMIYNFLGWLKDNPEPPNTQTDKDKIIAHGFDTKTSFRPKIKE